MDNLYLAVIHDIKNQLTELALRLEQQDDCSGETSIALSAARRLTQLLLAQRWQAGQLEGSIDSHCPIDLMEELAAEYRVLFPQLDITVGAGQAPNYWFYEDALMRLALSNAMHNACRSALRKVGLQAIEENGWLVLSVRDDGPGFPPEILACQARPEPMPVSRSGTGLGLFLAEEIAGLHRNEGRVGCVELANQNGAVFRIRIP